MHADRTNPLPEALVFDLDGTLVDSVDDLTEASNRMLQEYGHKPLDSNTLRGYIGDGAKKLVERSLGGGGTDLREALHRFRRHYADCLLDHTRCYPGVEATVHVLESRGLRLGVVTNKPHEFSVRILQGLGLAPHLHSIVGARKGMPVKPAPEMLDLCLEQLGVLPTRAWMVGDSPNDVRVARAVGCTAVAVGYGIGSRAALVEEAPDHLVEDFGEILQLLP